MYHVRVENTSRWTGPVYMVLNGSKHVDSFRRQGCAEYAARSLNAGTAHIEPHHPIGCRVQPRMVA